jgi:hypothetical protein
MRRGQTTIVDKEYLEVADGKRIDTAEQTVARLLNGYLLATLVMKRTTDRRFGDGVPVASFQLPISSF